MTSVAIHLHRIEYPAQILSLLSNTAGHHILAFSNDDIKARFLHKLHYTLYKGWRLSN